ncbi:uncharacterized protein PADG_00217 [Paracoccidioides brasiliensis Pb18]|uniref:Uncharacterized protein n=1 Tax=Paracoccidioides brasiliensis (strain Pb18) TaxID=502780 RepID=C1G027_PARBD|nr:uncharacterized protein PADG_00217 [Paracoccidioides brasiliensis Pb18]EEH43928.2 hypothetical protein PADG_00217 [Paracoccidioides brasiliensis Pb18]
MGQSTSESTGEKARRDERWGKKYQSRLESTRGRIKDITRPVAGPPQREPVVDSLRQLSGKVVDKDMKNELVRSEYKTPEQMIVTDAVLTLPPRVPEGELQRQIAAIHGVSVNCGAEEYPLCRRLVHGSSRMPIAVKPTAFKAEVMGQP